MFRIGRACNDLASQGKAGDVVLGMARPVPERVGKAGTAGTGVFRPGKAILCKAG